MADPHAEASSATREPSMESLMYMFHHIFLPPKLAQDDDANSNIADLENDVLHGVFDSLAYFSGLVPDSAASSIRICQKMVENVIQARYPGGEIAGEALQTILARMQVGDVFALHLRAQNAGILITRGSEDLIFEPFELLAPNNVVMGCKGSLIRSFPSLACKLPYNIGADERFQSTFVEAILQLDSHTDPDSRPQTRKAGSDNSEERDTVDPHLVTEMLSSFIRGIGGQDVSVIHIEKRSREQTLYTSGNRVAWHRSAGWLFLRVALRLVLDRADHTAGRQPSTYKTFIAFHLATILNKARLANMSSDDLFAMSAKVSRRVQKLDIGARTPWLDYISEAVQDTKAILDARWQRLQTIDSKQHKAAAITSLSFDQDTVLDLDRLSQHLQWVKSRSLERPCNSPSGPTHQLLRHKAETLPTSLGENTVFDLLEFEAWVARFLQEWTTRQIARIFTETAHNIIQLNKLITSYHGLAQQLYIKNPEALSVAYLTVMELWVACDKLAIHSVPLMKSYPPEIPAQILEKLLLPKLNQMKRLTAVESHLQQRHQQRQSSGLSMFNGFGATTSFAIRFYDQTPSLHAKLRQAQIDQANGRERKLKELAELKATYNAAMRDHYTLPHQTVHEMDYDGVWRTRCLGSCGNCRALARAKGMSMEVWEDLLPEDDLEAKTVIAEMNMDHAVRAWRNATLEVLRDIFVENKTAAASEKVYWLCEIQRLRKYGHEGRTNPGRLQLGSTAKPYTTAHYGTLRVSEAQADMVCKPHGCQYDYWDRSLISTMNGASIHSAVPSQCSLASLDPRPLIKSYIRGTSHTSNDVIASQHACPETMSLAEFRAFGHIRSGVKLQWHNILGQLVSPSLNLGAAETSMLLIQATYEAGPRKDSGDVLRIAHCVVQEEKLGIDLLDGLRSSLRRIERNWESANGFFVLLGLCVRILSISTSELVQDQCMEHLKELRRISFKWTKELFDKVDQADSPEQRKELSEIALFFALICHGTFDVGAPRLSLLLRSAEEASIMINCSVLCGEYSKLAASSHNPLLRVMVHRRERLCHEGERQVGATIIAERSNCLDLAVKFFWPAYNPGNSWAPVLDTDARRHVLQTRSASAQGARSLPVSFNLLSGALLVDGMPISTLPQEYQAHRTFQSLFGNSVPKVVVSNREGMDFSGSRKHHDWDIHFALRGQDLIVQAIRETQVYEFVPSEKLGTDIPVVFVQSYYHWLNVASGEIEFRPLDTCWHQSDDQWTLKPASRKLERGSRQVLGLRSKTAVSVSQVLLPLEDPHYVSCILNNGQVEIDVVRLRLTFLLEPSSSAIWSKNYAGMRVAENQFVGTLIGLKNRLVLRTDKALSQLNRKILLVPQGTLAFHATDHSVTVSVKKPQPTGTSNSTGAFPVGSVEHCVFHVDEKLGKLDDSGSLQEKLYLAHLHALTSFPLPDPLTGRTGTEESLRILNSASVKSFQELDADSMRTLQNIRTLSPQRQFYPQDLISMETVTWSGLPVLSQDDAFRLSVNEILAHDRECQIFRLSTRDYSEVPDQTSLHLVERAVVRNSVFRVSGFGAEKATKQHDVIYYGRPNLDKSRQRGRSAASIARSIVQPKFELLKTCDSWFRSWTIPTADGKIQGPSSTTQRPLQKLKLDIKLPFVQFLEGEWCRLHELLSRGVDLDRDKYLLSMMFATFAFSVESQNATKDLNAPKSPNTWRNLQTVIAFLKVSQMRTIDPPPFTFFDLGKGYEVVGSELHSLIKNFVYPLERCPENSMAKKAAENHRTWTNRKRLAYDQKVRSMVNSFVSGLMTQLPCQVPTMTYPPDSWCYMDIRSVQNRVLELFDNVWRNQRFRAYMHEIGKVMAKLPVAESTTPAITLAPVTSLRTGSSNPQKGFIDFDDVFSASPPTIKSALAGPMLPVTESLGDETAQHHRDLMSGLLQSLRSHASDAHEQKYVSELEESASARAKAVNRATDWGDQSIQPILLQHLEESRNALGVAEKKIRKQLNKTIPSTLPAMRGSHWPRLSPVMILQQLSRDRWSQLHGRWKRCVVDYALALAAFQRAERLLLAKSREELRKEVHNVGHTNWDPMDHPESLLLEVESGLLIREVQHEIAAKMQDPAEGQSSVMQLNMGEGKSSVIVPVVAAALADDAKLVRVVVAKPQSKQMHQMMNSKLGGLLNRRIFFLPFSRSLQLTTDGAQRIRSLLARCREEGGVLLVQPEQLLSFKLMGLENLYSGKNDVGEVLLATQNWLDEVSRDIVDESDENFNVKFELVYTMGTQQPVDLDVQRWGLVQTLLRIVVELCEKMHAMDPDGIQCDRSHQGTMPVIRILDHSAGEQLLQQLADHICRYGIEGFPIHRQPAAFREKILTYIMSPDVSESVVQDVEDERNGFYCDTTRGPLLLLRGLIAGGVLAFALGQKRWRVNFGRTKTRIPPTLLAVPFRAKDSPAPRSEFSHPDVVILLTCLTYYYEGLTNEELDISFERLDRTDQSEFDLWIRDAAEVEPAFRQLSGINLKDRKQCINHVYPAIRHSKSAIDFYLSKVVFAKHMREFPKKLSASGWDLARETTHPVTGFSGTCDSKYVLPLTIKHLDLSEQRHTNASVLRCLLRPENNVRELCGPLGGTQTKASVSDILLKSVIESDVPIQVILDVGAQILELDNIEAARQWLANTTDSSIEAAIFFDEDDELSVLTRNDVVERLLTSSYLKHTEKCLVFLDEAHTRGTDLKLPELYRAAVTLGPKLTKDRLVQACMRMRKLGVGQSVTFFILPEIQMRIRQLRSIPSATALTVTDVLVWSISETWTDSRKSIPLWATQGLRHQRQEVIWQNNFVNKERRAISGNSLGKYLEDEAQTLAQRYSPRQEAAHEAFVKELQDAELISRREELNLIKKKCDDHNILTLKSASLQEEQERELSPELEQERQIEMPAAQKPARHLLAPAVKSFVSSGSFPQSKTGTDFLPAFTAFRDSTASLLFEAQQFPCDIYATKDFIRTVVPGRDYTSNLYQRPVQWIVSSKQDDTNGAQQTMVIMSPWEVNELYDELKRSKSVHLHLYLPRTNLAYPSLDHLRLFSAPRLPTDWVAQGSLVVQLNLFAGQLWLQSYEEYVEICRFLGLSSDQGEGHVGADGFEGKTERNPDCAFDKSPVPFLRVVASGIRADCQDVGRTDLGRILGGEILRPVDFEDREDAMAAED